MRKFEFSLKKKPSLRSCYDSFRRGVKDMADTFKGIALHDASLRPRLVGDSSSQSDFRPLAFSTLRTLQKRIDMALPRTTDPITVEHLRDAKKQIADILDPKFGPSGASAPQVIFPFFLDSPPPQDEKHRPDFRCSLYQPVDWRKFFFGHD